MPWHYPGVYLLVAVSLCVLLITGCAPNKAELNWQQDREALQSQLKDVDKSQAMLTEQLRTLNNQLSDLETLMVSHAEDQKTRLDQNEARLIELDKKNETRKKSAAHKSKSTAARKNKPLKKPKAEKVLAKAKAKAKKNNGPASPKQTPVISNEEIKRAYIKAYLALKSGHYEQAATDFINFLSKFPASKYAHQASYWLGETLHAQGKTEQAVEAFQKASGGAPNKDIKWNAAQLRLGQLYKELGRNGEARTTFLRLVKEHPQSPEAETARKLLSEAGSSTDM